MEKVYRGSSKKTPRTIKLLALSITNSGPLVVAHTTTLIQLLSIWKDGVCPSMVTTPCFHV